MTAAALPDKALAAEGAYRKRCQLARDDLRTYIELCAKDEDGRPIRLAPLHLAWIWHVDYCWSRGLNAGIMAPFGSGKTSAFAVPLATFLVGRDPQVRIKYVSNGDDFAKQRVQSAASILLTPEYQDVFPHVRRGAKWSDHAIFVKRDGNAIDPTLHARGVLTKGVGGRADRIIFDDVCDQENTESEAQRKRVKLRVGGTWMSRLDNRPGDPGLAMMIATAWHPDDATHELMANPTWCFLVQRVSADFLSYEQEVFGAGPDYMDGRPG